jgi:hypothetical protein
MMHPKVAGGVQERFACPEKQPKSSALQIAIVGALSHIEMDVPSKFRASLGGFYQLITRTGAFACGTAHTGAY